MEGNMEELLNIEVGPMFSEGDLKLIDLCIGLDKLSQEQQDVYLLKISGLPLQRSNSCRSKPVDGYELDEKLRQLPSDSARDYYSRATPTPPGMSAPSSPASDAESIICLSSQPREESLLKTQKREIIKYNTLVSQGKIPPFPIEDRVKTILDAEEHKDIIHYWYAQTCSYKIFAAQVRDWRKFRQFQQTKRRMAQKDWEDYQRKILDGQSEYEDFCVLLLDPDAQSTYTTWLEYQNYHQLAHEDIQASIDKRQKFCRDAQEKLDENDDLRLTEGDTTDYRKPSDLSNRLLNAELELQGKAALINDEVTFAERRILRVNDHPEKTVKIHVWVLPLKREMELYQSELDRIDAMPKYAYNSAEEITKGERLYYDQKLKLTERLLYASISDFDGKSFAKGIEKSIIISQLKSEVQSKLKKIKDIDAELESIYLRRRYADAWHALVLDKVQLERHQILIDWIEQQRCTIASKIMNAESQRDGTKHQSSPKELPQTEPFQNTDVERKETEDPLESSDSPSRKSTGKKRAFETTSPQSESPRKKRKQTPNSSSTNKES